MEICLNTVFIVAEALIHHYKQTKIKFDIRIQIISIINTGMIYFLIQAVPIY